LFVSFEITRSFVFLLLLLRLLRFLCSLLEQTHDPDSGKHQISGDAADEDRHGLLEAKVEQEAGNANKSEGHGTDPSRHRCEEATNGQAKREVVILLMGDNSSDDPKTQQRKDKATDEATVHANGQGEDPSKGSAQEEMCGVDLKVFDDGCGGLVTITNGEGEGVVDESYGGKQ
jgi:hypothetical protein